MMVRFNGGPLDGQSQEIGDEPDVGAVITWPPNAVERHDDAIPGADDVVGYLYRGQGAADYVGGLLEADVDPTTEG